MMMSPRVVVLMAVVAWGSMASQDVMQEGPGGVRMARRLTDPAMTPPKPPAQRHPQALVVPETKPPAATMFTEEPLDLTGRNDAPSAPSSTLPLDMLAKEAVQIKKQNAIDFVMLWTDYGDPGVSERMLRAGADPAFVAKRVRDPSGEMLRFALRSYATNAPFVRRIHLVVPDEQDVPLWLSEADHRVNVVRHSVIFDRPHNDLPTFNDAAVEANLDNVPGLSERFCLINEQMLVTAPIIKTDLFTLDGRAKSFFDSDAAGGLGKVVVNSNKLLQNYQTLKTKTMSAMEKPMLDHIKPMLLSSLVAISTRFAPELQRTSKHKLPDSSDVSLVQLSLMFSLDAGDVVAGHWHESEFTELKLDGSSHATVALAEFAAQGSTASMLTRIYGRYDRYDSSTSTPTAHTGLTVAAEDSVVVTASDSDDVGKRPTLTADEEVLEILQRGEEEGSGGNMGALQKALQGVFPGKSIFEQ